ncbi:MAG: hypothetical protein AAGK21_05945 [Bacteroidota bacterium]
MNRFILLLAVASGTAAAQTPDEITPTWDGCLAADHRVYASAGVGLSSVGRGGAIASASLTYEYADHVAVTALALVDHELGPIEFNLFTDPDPEPPGTVLTTETLAVLVGRPLSDGRYVTALVSVGPALVRGERYTGRFALDGTDETVAFQGLHAAAQAEAVGRILPVFGLGARIGAVAGPEVQTVSGGVLVRIGRVW